jgi:Cd2+/Zn2+-exporting ATPase
MNCAAEEALIRTKLGGMRGVTSMKFDLLRRGLIVEHERETIGPILSGLRSLGFDPRLVPVPESADRTTDWLLGLSCVAVIAAEIASWLGAQSWIIAALALSAVAVSGLAPYRQGWVAICRGNFNLNALLSIAVTGALLIGAWSEAAMVMVSFTIAEFFETKSLRRARNAIAELTKLTPDRTSARQPDGTWNECAVSDVEAGAVVRVEPGEQIALDGEIVGGRSNVNQSPITGESRPVRKGKGDPVFAGTTNQTGSLEILVTASAYDSTLARIVHAIEEAKASRAPTQRIVERFVRTYTPAVLIVALAVALVPPLTMDGRWFDWIYRALTLLVIACPCALVIAAPVTIVSGIAAAARRGILVKGGTFLERGRCLRWLALDKAGTLTQGAPVQTAFELVDPAFEQSAVRAFAASLAGRSGHPASRAIALAARNDHVPRFAVSRFGSVPGRGVYGCIGGRGYWLGNLRLMAEIGYYSEDLQRRVEVLERDANTVVMLAGEKGVLALFALVDKLKPTCREAIERLHAVGVRTAILTGDNAHAAKAIAKQAGIDRAEGGLLPEDKLRIVESLRGAEPVGMVGDGISDAPALARADIAFAMSAMDIDTAIETADVALMDDDLRKLPAFIRISKATHLILMQNIAFAVGIKVIFLGLALAGFGPVWLAVFADAGASLIVVGNGLRLLRTPTA